MDLCLYPMPQATAMVIQSPIPVTMDTSLLTVRSNTTLVANVILIGRQRLRPLETAYVRTKALLSCGNVVEYIPLPKEAASILIHQNRMRGKKEE